MVDNTRLNAGSAGDLAATKEVSHGGDTAKLMVTSLVGVSGSEGAYTIADIDGTAANGLEVDVTRVQAIVPGTGATNLGKAEDAAHSGGDTGVMALAVRNDTLAALAGADGDYAPIQVSAEGAVFTAPGDFVSTNNSTTTPLGIDAVFTGTGDDCLNYSTVCCTLFADQASATDGMTFQFSTDNSNWDDVYTHTMTASEPRRFQLPVCARYFRIVYTNGGTGQGAFRAQTILHRANQLTSIHRLVDDMSPDRSAQVMKSVVFAQAAGSGDFKAIAATGGGNLKMSVQEISDGLDIGAGNAGLETQRVSVSTDDVNLSAIKTAVEIMDDWDETNRAKVNVIAGQAGIAGGTGVDGATVPRVTLATDVGLPAGTAAIGKLAANSGVDIGDVDVISIVPGTAATNLGKAEDAAHSSGDVGVMPLAVRNDDLAALAETDGDYAPLQVTQNGALLMCPAANDDYKYAVIDDAVSGDNTIVTAVVSRKIRVLAAFLVSEGTVTARFESGAAGTALTGQMNLVANSGFTLPFNPAGWFETGVNALLNLELSAAISVDGSLTYIEVP